MNIDLAKTFLEVVSAGSFARAAERLNVTHSTVTMRIKALEDILRRRVLVRNKAGASMTAEGIRFYRYAEALVRTWQMSRRHMSLASGFADCLSIGAETSLWDDLMYEWVCKTRAERPDVAIRCEDGNAEILLQRLFQGWLDVGLVYTPHSQPGFLAEPLFDDPLVLVSTEDRCLKPVADAGYIEIDWDEAHRSQMENIWGYADETPHVSANSGVLGLRFVEDLGGTIWLPQRLLEARTFKRKLYLVRDAPSLERTAFMIYSPEVLRERLPNMPIEQIRNAILNQLSGRPEIWAQAST